VVLSACPPRAPEIAKTRAAFEAAGVPVAKVEIETRRSMDRALQYGESVIEFEPDGESAKQINALLNEVLA
jgi:chromosome partitioning protein